MTGAAELRAEFNQPGSWVRECAESLQMTLAKRRVLPTFVEPLHRRLEPDAVVFCASQRFQGSAEEPWHEKPETGDMASRRHHDDSRPIEVVDTLFTEELLRELRDIKTRELQIALKPWWCWASYRLA